MSYANWPVLKRFIPSLRKRYAAFLPKSRYRLVRRDGAIFLANYRTWAGRTTIIHGVVERPQLDYLIRQIVERRCDLFLDIGAHMGIYAIMAAHRTSCRRIIAFEPDPHNFANLEANLLVNGLLDQVERNAIAVSDRDGMVPFAAGLEHDVWSKVSEDADTANITVSAARLDSILMIHDQSIAIKMDIEMHELHAVNGMRQLLKSNRCLLQVECFANYLPPFIETMTSLGYRQIHAIGNDHYFANDG